MATLVGLDFGSTTSSCLVATAAVRRNAATGRMELADVRERFRSELAFTPLAGEQLDVPGLEALVDGWLAAARLDPDDVIGGGALLTGLTARRDNAAVLAAAVRRRLVDAVVAVADDPCLESWLAFQGSAAALSRRSPDRWFLHLDIGGGTTNVAVAKAGGVRATACVAIGARHVRLAIGTTVLAGHSSLGRAVLERLGLPLALGADLGAAGVERIAAWYLDLLHALVGSATGGPPLASDPLTAAHVQVPLPGDLPAAAVDAAVTLSGGVGQLVYDLVAGRDVPGVGGFGDIGTSLARGLVDDPRCRDRWREHRPDAGGRATVAGLLRHTTRVSGASLHLPDAAVLPLADVPIVADLHAACDEAAVRGAVGLAARGRRGAGLRITGLRSAAEVRAFGARLADAFATVGIPGDVPVVLLLDTDAGKALGLCATRWGGLPMRLLAIDELDLPDARFVALGRPRDGVVPVTFHGLTT